MLYVADEGHATVRGTSALIIMVRLLHWESYDSHTTGAMLLGYTLYTALDRCTNKTDMNWQLLCLCVCKAP